MLSFLQNNWSAMTNPEIATHLKLSLTATRKKCYELGLLRMTLDYWTIDQVKFLRTNYRKIGDKELAILFNMMWFKNKPWTWKHIEKKRLYLDLNRTPQQLSKIKVRNRLRGCWLNTSTWQTRGEAAIGSIRIWYHEQRRFPFKVYKTKDGWVHYAHWLYIQTYGPFPKNTIVGFKDGNNMNVVPENLEAITRSEHAARNRTGILKYPPDLLLTANAINKLNHSINSIQNEKRA